MVRFICEANGYSPMKIGQHFLDILPRISPHLPRPEVVNSEDPEQN